MSDRTTFMLPIDRIKSTHWAISSRLSVGTLLIGRHNYDLVNLNTNRAHLLSVTSTPTLGIETRLEVSASLTPEDYAFFRTNQPVDFEAFHGKGARETDASVFFYSSSYLTVWNGSAYTGILDQISPPQHYLRVPRGTRPSLGPILLYVKWVGWGISTPGGGISHGITSIIYGNGKSRGEVPAAAPIELPMSREDVDMRVQYQTKDDSLVIKFQGDFLFDFDKDNIKAEAGPSLNQAGAVIRSSRIRQVQIDGHTDGIDGYHANGTVDLNYNVRLSERRAKAVSQWFRSNKYLRDGLDVQTKGWGKSKPVQPNTLPNGLDNKDGRTQNRRVEIFLIKR